MMRHSIRNNRPNKKATKLVLSLGIMFLCFAMVGAVSGLKLEIVLLGGDPVQNEYGDTYHEAGFRTVLKGNAFLKDGIEVPAQVQISGTVCAEKLGVYPIEYHASWLFLKGDALRTVHTVDTTAPRISLTPDEPDLQPAPAYQEAGFCAYDDHDGDLTAQVIRTVEEGRIIYTVADSSGNVARAQREIPIFDDYPPELQLLCNAQMTIYLGEAFHDPGYTALDKRDGDLTAQVNVHFDHPFVRYQPDTYQIAYQVTDSDGHEATAHHTLTTVPYPAATTVFPKGKTIYLTFDDGPGPDTARLLDILERYQVKATFFVVDTGHPDLLKRIVDEGHSIGIHTCSHRYSQIYSSEDAYFQDLFAMQQIILESTGVETWLLRFPGGSSNTISRKNHGIMTRLTGAVTDCGFSYFDWNVDSQDAGGASSSAQVLQNVVQGIGSNQCSIVLQHDIHSYSVDAVEQIIQWGLENGYQFLPLQTDSPTIHHPVLN